MRIYVSMHVQAYVGEVKKWKFYSFTQSILGQVVINIRNNIDFFFSNDKLIDEWEDVLDKIVFTL